MSQPAAVFLLSSLSVCLRFACALKCGGWTKGQGRLTQGLDGAVVLQKRPLKVAGVLNGCDEIHLSFERHLEIDGDQTPDDVGVP